MASAILSAVTTGSPPHAAPQSSPEMGTEDAAGAAGQVPVVVICRAVGMGADADASPPVRDGALALILALALT